MLELVINIPYNAGGGWQKRKSGYRFTVAVFDTTIVGMIGIRDRNHITLLFVDRKYRNRGIANRLCKDAVAESVRRYPDITTFTVNSSPSAVGFYERIGFEKAEPQHMKEGMLITPMILRLTHQ